MKDAKENSKLDLDGDDFLKKLKIKEELKENLQKICRSNFKL